jgi:hypothetical protein
MDKGQGPNNAVLGVPFEFHRRHRLLGLTDEGRKPATLVRGNWGLNPAE